MYHHSFIVPTLEMETESEHQEVHKEETAVNTVRALKKWYRDQHLAVWLFGQPKK
jgi:hypothetical protein